jgi:hypothetical protein
MEAIYPLILLTMPIDSQIDCNEKNWPFVRDSIQNLCVNLEILDRRETSYIMAKYSDSHVDMKLLRKRYNEFMNAPPISDSYRLPERNMVNDLIVFNRNYRRHLVERQCLELDRNEKISYAIRETDLLYKIYDAARDARCEFYYITVRRAALKKLKDFLGDEDYTANNFPPIVPFWYFNEYP